MRKFIRMCLTLLLGAVLILYLAPAACAESGEWGDLDWELNTDGQLTVTGSGDMDDLSANDAWRPYKAEISSVVIGEGVTSIGANAFASCTKLTCVTIPESVETIGDSAFSYCEALVEAVIPDGVTDIDGSAFFACGSLITVTIPGSMEKIGEGAFFGCDDLTDVYYTNAPEAWSGMLIEDANDALTDATRHCIFGRGVWGRLNWILDRDGLLSVTGSSKMDDFEFGSSDAWHSFVTEILRVEIGKGVTSIGKNAFENCSYMTNAAIPGGVKSIGKSAFALCYDLESITIPSGVESIGEDAFYTCLSLPTVTVPASVTSIGQRAFGNCECLTEIRVKSGNKAYCDVDGVLFDKNVTTVLQCPRGREGKYALPTTVKTIGPFAFESCLNLTEVAIPSGVTSIGQYGFCSCSGLTEVAIPEGVTDIGDYAFMYCTKMKSVTIPSKTVNLGSCAFKNSGLTSVTIPGSVATIQEDTFMNCQNLSTATILDGITAIGYDAFCDCASLKSVAIPASLVDVYEGAFYHCDSLTVIFYGGTPQQWQSILDDLPPANAPLKEATVYYGAVPDLILPGEVTEISREAFMGGAFRFVQLPESTARIGKNAFADCPNLTYIHIPGMETQIDNGAFGNRTALTVLGKAGSTAETFAQSHGFTFIEAG